MMKYLAAAALALATTSAAAENVPVGQWTIETSIDPMTDDLRCMAVRADHDHVWITPTALVFSYSGRGGLNLYRYRIDDEEPSALRGGRGYPSRKFLRIADEVFKERVLTAKRVRAEVSTLVSGMIYEDVDVSDAGAIVAKMGEMGCVAY